MSAFRHHQLRLHCWGLFREIRTEEWLGEGAGDPHSAPWLARATDVANRTDGDKLFYIAEYSLKKRGWARAKSMDTLFQVRRHDKLQVSCALSWRGWSGAAGALCSLDD